MLLRVLYVSYVAQGVTGADIERLIASSRRRNRQLDLTGALVVCARRFAQVLEGREDAVKQMMEKISTDPRHSNMRLIEEAQVSRRLCDSWDMAFVDDESWAQTLDDVASGAMKPESFFEILLRHYEENRVGRF